MRISTRPRLSALAVAAALAAASGCSSDPGRTGPVSHTTQLVQYESCDALEADLKEMLIADAEARIEQYGDGDIVFPPEAGDADTDASGEGDRQEGEDFSGTNNQEEGVDEADFVKTDGYHIYTLNGNRLHIFGVPEFGDLVPESETEIEGHPREMLINRDAGRVVVFSQIYPYSLPEEHPLRVALGIPSDTGDYWWRVEDVTKLTVIDVSDPTAPQLVREVFVEGWYQTARRIEGAVVVGAYSWMLIPGLDEIIWGYYDGSDMDAAARKAAARSLIEGLALGDLVPRMYERLPDGSFGTVALDDGACQSFYRPTNSHGRGISSLLSLDLFSDELAVEADFIMTNWATYYASSDRLYLAESANDWWWFWWNEDQLDQTNLHAFDISTPGSIDYEGSGRIDGMLLNQFSMGEHESYLRVAATTNMWGRWWVDDPVEPESHVYVMELVDHELQQVGHVGGIAPNERLFASRFVGDRGYLVTFEQIDPLFTLDLSDPYNPLVVGELEVPGFSTYLHPLSQDRLLAIGVGGDDTGANWRAQISLFDTSEFDAPELFDTEELVAEGDWGWSEAMYEHKAFQFWAPRKLLAVPLSTYREYSDSLGWHWDYTSRLELITVDAEAGLSRYGTIDHSAFFNSDPDRMWYYRDVRRSIFMGDYVYAISDRGITSHLTDDLSVVNEAELPGYSPDDYYWWW